VRLRKWLLGAGAVVLGALLYQIPRAILLAYYLRQAGWTAAEPATLYIATSVTPVAGLALFVALLHQLASEASPLPQPRPLSRPVPQSTVAA
jgi:hypothetical protein